MAKGTVYEDFMDFWILMSLYNAWRWLGWRFQEQARLVGFLGWEMLFVGILWYEVCRLGDSVRVVFNIKLTGGCIYRVVSVCLVGCSFREGVNDC